MSGPPIPDGWRKLDPSELVGPKDKVWFRVWAWAQEPKNWFWVYGSKVIPVGSLVGTWTIIRKNMDSASYELGMIAGRKLGPGAGEPVPAPEDPRWKFYTLLATLVAGLIGTAITGYFAYLGHAQSQQNAVQIEKHGAMLRDVRADQLEPVKRMPNRP